MCDYDAVVIAAALPVWVRQVYAGLRRKDTSTGKIECAGGDRAKTRE